MDAVAKGHGGDAGGDPPIGPNKIPSSCETVVGNIKKVRGKSRSLNLLAAFKANGRKPLPIEFDRTDLKTYQPVGDNHTLFTRCIGNWIGFGIPTCYENWDKVPESFKMAILSRLQYYFQLKSYRNGPDWPFIVAGIERFCKDRYRDRKNKNKTHFMENGGYEDVARAKQHPPSNVNSENWSKTIDHFLDPKFRNRSQKNTENRAHGKYPSLHGSSSYAASRYKKKDPQTQVSPSLINFWAEMHRKKTGEWVNDLAEKDYEKMLEEQDKMLEEQESETQGSSSMSIVNEIKIISKVLGESHGHNTGRGRKLKGVSTSLFASQFQSTETPPGMYTTEEVQDLVDQFNENAKRSNLNLQALFEAFVRINPEVTLPTMHELTPINLPPPRQPAPQQPQHTDSGEDEPDLADD